VIRNPGLDKMPEIMSARNAIAAQAKHYLFFLDDDVVPPSDTLLKLFGLLRAHPRARVAGGIYFGRTNTQKTLPMCWNLTYSMMIDFPRGKPFLCGGLATGCFLLDTSVLAEVPAPSFRYEASGSVLLRGDDEILCTEIIKLGYDVVAHGGIICPHLDARIESSNFAGRSPWELRRLSDGQFVDVAGNKLLRSQL
jgi:GT2 family glycosyltransferase